MFSNDPAHLRPWLALVPKWKIGFRDNDDAGKKLIKYVDECRVMTLKDLGDSTDEEIIEMVRDIMERRDESKV
jgi:hypothetical protein